MGDTTAPFKQLEDSSHAWALYALLSKVPLPPMAVYGLLSISLYIIFLALALLSGVFIEVVGSPMHFLQISCSISIFAAFSLGRLSANIFINALSRTKEHFNYGEEAYRKTYTYIITEVRSGWSLIITVPFTIIAITLFTIISESGPDSLFPVARSSVLFIFVAYVEISIFMVYLLGSVGLWCLVVITTAFKKLKRYNLKFNALRPSSNLNELSKALFTGTFLQFLVYSTIAPFIFYLSLEYSELEVILWLGTIGIGSAYMALLTLTVSTQNSIHSLLVKAKYRRLDEIADAFTRHQHRIEEFPGGFSDGENGLQELKEIVGLNSYLMRVYEDTDQKIKTWLIDLTSIGKLFASSLIPIATFVSLVVALFK